MESWNGTDNIPLLDASGSTVAMVDAATGNIATSYTYDPLGSAAVTGSGYQTAYQFQGMENDAWAYYKPGRYYSPLMGRPLSSTGPLTAPGGYDSGLAGVVSASMPGSGGSDLNSFGGLNVSAGAVSGGGALVFELLITALGPESWSPPAEGVVVTAVVIDEILSLFGIDLFGGGHPYIPPLTRWEIKHPGGAPPKSGQNIGMRPELAPDQRPSAGRVMTGGLNHPLLGKQLLWTGQRTK
jgi:hypothetical protein